MLLVLGVMVRVISFPSSTCSSLFTARSASFSLIQDVAGTYRGEVK